MKNQINLPSLPLLLSSLLLPINIQTFGALGYLPQLQIMFPCTPLIRMLLLLLKALLLVELLHCLMNLQECSQLMKKKVKGRVTIKKTSIQKLVLLPLWFLLSRTSGRRCYYQIYGLFYSACVSIYFNFSTAVYFYSSTATAVIYFFPSAASVIVTSTAASTFVWW